MSLGISGGYGLSSAGFYNTVSAMNTLKFQQIMSSKGGSVPSIQPMGKALDSASSTFLKDYQSAMTDMMNAANELKGGSTSKTMGFSSSDSKVADVSSRFGLTNEAKMELDVKQLASAQTNRSTGVKSTATPASGGTLTLTDAQGQSAIFVADPMAKNNRDQLTAMAKQINNRNVGYTAKVVDKDGQSSLEIIGTKTGSDGAFTASGEFAQRTGLDTAAQQAQNAVYTVDKGDGRGPQEFTSSTNTVSVGDYRIEASLKQTGSTTVSVGRDQGASAGAVKKMVDSFNKTLSLLNQNSSRGVGVLAQMRRMVVPPASEKSMEQIGISVKNDGSLSFDADTFADMMKRQPKLGSEIVENVAQGIYQDAQQGMNTSSASLLGFNGASTTGGGLSNVQLQTQQDPLNFMSSYAKSGAYNLMNYYAVGALMNFSI